MNLFDRIASTVSKQVAHAWFFCMCVLLIVLWVPTFVFLNIDTWQLVINTLTTIITFLLVALLQNDQRQFENTVHHKLDIQSTAIARFMVVMAGSRLQSDIQKLEDSIGSERKIGA